MSQVIATLTRPRRRVFAFGLRAMMGLVLVTSIFLAWKVNRGKTQLRAIAAIEKAGANVVYDYTYSGEYPYKYGEPVTTERLRGALGEQYFREITAVVFPDRTSDVDLAVLDDLDWLMGVEFFESIHVTDAGLAHLGERTGLRRAMIQGTQMTDASLAVLATLPRLERLILLRNSKLTDAGLESIGKMTALRELAVIDAGITGQGVAHLKGLTRLESLSLGGTKADDAGLSQLAGLTRLKELDLSYTRLTDAGLKILASFPNLEVLNLRGVAGLTDAGIMHLAGLKRLKKVDLSETPISDAGLVQANGLPGVVNLDLEKVRITPEGLAALRKANPKASINTTMGSAASWYIPTPVPAVRWSETHGTVLDPSLADLSRFVPKFRPGGASNR
jgi:hypothetical protein